MELFYAGIGPRDTPEDVCYVMTDIGRQLSDSGWVLRSGRARGADQAFEAAAAQAEILLPWDTYEGARADGERYFVPRPNPYIDIAIAHHSYWNQCNKESKLLLTRNVPILLGHECGQPVRMVVTWLPNGTKYRSKGGTNHACRVAQAHDIPIFNIQFERDRQALIRFVAEMESWQKAA